MNVKRFLRMGFALLVVLSMLLSPALHGSGREARAEGTGSICGTVTGSETGNPPLVGSVVYVFDSSNNYVGSSTTSATGYYSFGGLATGTYKVSFLGDAYHAAEYYSDAKYIFQATPVSVTEPESTTVNAELQEAGCISGTVTGSGTGNPALAGIRVYVYDLNHYYVGSSNTNSAGVYSVYKLVEGDYKVFFHGNSTYAYEFYGDESLFAFADTVSVSGLSTTTADAVLDPGGSITGKVTGSEAGSPGLGNVNVQLFDSAGDMVKTYFTDSDGNYVAGAVPSGDYRINFIGDVAQPFEHQSEYFDNRSTLDSADVISVAGTETVAGVDAVLQAVGTISGHVTGSEEGSPAISGMTVRVFDTSGTLVKTVLTDSSGSYQARLLPIGYYKVFFAGDSTHRSEYFSDRASFDTADTLAVAESSITAADAVLTLSSGIIQGVVTGSETGNPPLAGIPVEVHNDDGGLVGTTTTDASGNYCVADLQPDVYRLYFGGDSTHLAEWYSNQVSFGSSTPFTVPSSNIKTIDVVLRRSIGISGTVTGSEAGNPPLAGITVAIYGLDNTWLFSVQTDASGRYRTGPLAAGLYKICFRGGTTHKTEYYNNRPSFSSADIVRVTDQETYADAVLEAAGAITGTITSSSETGGVDGLNVYLYDADNPGSWLGRRTTYDGGRYSFYLIEPGDYKVCFSPISGMSYLEQWYNDELDFDAAETITVSPGETESGIDAVLVSGGAITGTVTSSSETGGVNGLNVYLYDAGDPDGWLKQTTTDGSGIYLFDKVHPGEYKIYFAGDATHLAEYYNDQPGFDVADTVTVTELNTITADAVVSRPAGSVVGTVTGSEAGNPALAGVQIELYDCSDTKVRTAATDASGNYSFAYLPDGDYRLRFGGDSAHMAEFYNDKASLALADLVSVSGAEPATADAVLDHAGSIEGVVTGVEAGNPALSGVKVDIYNADNVAIVSATTDAAGHYSSGLLVDGDYKIHFTSTDAHISEWYMDKDSYETADVVNVSGAVTADAVLNGYGSISGSLKLPAVYLISITVNAYRASDGVLVKSVPATFTLPSSLLGYGSYKIEGLLPGDYKLFFDLGSNTYYCDEWYNNSYQLITATPVTVNGFTATTGIDITVTARSAVTGRITDEDTGSPVAGCRVDFFNSSPEKYNPASTAVTDENGYYDLALWTTPNGKLYACPEDGEHVAEWYQCSGSYGSILNVDLSLGHGPVSLSGCVTDDESLDPLPDARVSAYDSAGLFAGYAVTGDAGTYCITSLPPDTYRVYFAGNSNHLAEWYDDKAGLDLADPVELNQAYAGADGIDAVLTEAYGSISGTVTGSEAGNPALAGITVEVYDKAHALLETVVTDSSGAYSVGGLPTGTYHVGFSGDSTHTGEFYEDDTSVYLAASVSVTIPGNTVVDAVLDLTIAGITGIDPVSGIAGSTVTLTGDHFGDEQGDSYVSFGSVAVSSYTSWSDTSVVCLVPDGAEGPLEVTLTTEAGTSEGVAFDVLTPPVLTGIDPASGIVGSTVTLAGDHFGDEQGDSYVSFGSVAVSSYTSWSDTSVVCLVPDGAEGPLEVTLTTEDGTSDAAGFTAYLYPAPTVAAITPASWTSGQVVNITDLAGTGFLDGATVALRQAGQSDIVASNVVVASPASITCDLDLTGAAAGVWDVVVTNPDGQSAILAGGFTVNAPFACGAGASGTMLMLGGMLRGGRAKLDRCLSGKLLP